MTTDHTEAIARMEHAFNLIVNYEFAWDQDFWRTGDQETACGTALCFAGWATAAADYKPVVEKPLELSKQLTGGWAEMEESISEALWTDLVVPEGDPYYEIARQKTPVQAIRDGAWGPTEQILEDRFNDVKARVIDIQMLANQLLSVDTGSGDGILNSSVFDGSNSLANIRAYIDEARQRADQPERDFTAEPVPVITDEWVPEDTIPQQSARVARFNKRASSPDRVILTDRHAMAYAG